MGDSIEEKIAKLLYEISLIDGIKAIGQTGDINVIPKPGESDIDIFVLGDKVPAYEERRAVYEKSNTIFEECRMKVCEGGDWGTGDVFIIDGVETMLMYFTIDETLKYVNEIFEGRHLDSVKGFYPVGRCATLKNINVIYDEWEVFACLKDKLSVYPEGLKKAMADFHLARTKDEEDFGRALRRKDVLFYHQVLEVSIDHYLQALYAVNKTFFPSRKRTKQYIDSFEIKPYRCYERLLEVVRLGSSPEGIEESYGEWCGLVSDLEHLYNGK
ncbi:MAG: DUF4037 domain-containing protein [Bacillota bacterium]|nr:DUF4037 domain-containing protein [Bacillota bacterium]